MIKEAEYAVVLTGAGISTAAGIPDFRGPRGIWTMEQQKKSKKILTIETGDNAIFPYFEGKESELELLNCVTPRKKSIEFKVQKNTYNVHDSNKTKSLKKRSISKVNNIIPQEITSVTFETAIPTLTHSSITKLVESGIIKYCITQNVDGLHMRSGLSREKYSFLHGCIFTERCEKCQAEYFRDFDIGGISCQKTGRTCTKNNCSGDLRDTLLDWEDELPRKDWIKSQNQCSKSDLVIALGTSLRINPVGSLPLLAKKFVIVNKQVTPYDTFATLVIRAPVDEVMVAIMSILRYA